MSDLFPLADAEAANDTENSSFSQRPFVITACVSKEGIEACTQFLSSLNSDATAIVLFASPGLQASELEQHISALDLLPTISVSEITPLAAKHIYVVPAATHVEIYAGALQIIDPPDVDVPPIDLFLTSVALVEKSRSIVLFFSPWLTHCLEGLKIIREAGGLILHNDSLSIGSPLKEYELYLSHLLDGSLPLDEISARVNAFILSSNNPLISGLSLQQEDIQAIEQLYHQLKTATGVRFSNYDLIYVLQHLRQRLQVHNLTHITEYVEFISSNTKELTLFARRLSLKYASFFHERKAMQFLTQYVLPTLMMKKGPRDTVRVWVPSCATGEEALSIAILLNDAVSSESEPPTIQVIATDSDQEILQLARQVQYPRSCIRGVPPIFREQYFEMSEGMHHVSDVVKEQVDFECLDSTLLPPYSDIDLVYCRGLLKRLKKEVQKQVLKHLHTVLSSDGFLVLGEGDAEINELTLFEPSGPSGLIFTPINKSVVEKEPPAKVSLFRKQEEYVAEPEPLESNTSSVSELHKDLVLQLQGPVSIIIKPDFSILDQIGNVGTFISWPNNGKTANLLEAFPETVRRDLLDAVAQSLNDKKSLQSKVLKPNDNGILKPFRLQMHPFFLPEEESTMVQVLFIADETPSDASVGKYKGKPIQQVVNKLESDLRHAKDRLNLLTGQLKERVQELNERPVIASAESETKILKQNAELKNTNTELLALNRDLVKRVEEMRKKMQAQLPQEIVTQTAEIEPSNMSGALQQQIRAFASKRHEIRTALTSIIGFADLLSDRLYDADNKELARYIHKAGHRLSDCMGSLLEHEFEEFEVFDSQPEIIEELDLDTNRLLVVEDSDATRRLLSLVLSDRFECELAANANEAIEKAEKELFKAVVLDINLGKGQSGVDVLHYLRQNTKYQRVPFMAVTALASPQDESMLLGKGFDAYVAKPFQKAKLLTKLDQMLESGSPV